MDVHAAYVLDSLGSGNASAATWDSCPEQKSTWLGYVFVSIAVIFLTLCYLAPKHVNSGDGMFYQWIFCSGIMVSGMVVNFIKSSPPVQPLAMVGGVVFAIGNMVVVPFVRLIGVSMGLVVSGAVSMLFGWASGRFGILGAIANPPCSSLMDYLGVVLCLFALVTSLFVKSEGDNAKLWFAELRNDRQLVYGENKPLLRKNIQEDEEATISGDYQSERSVFSGKSPWRRVLGYGLAIFAGINYGVSFNPIAHLMHIEAQKGNVTDKTAALDYVFSYYSGVYAASTLFFVVYIIVGLVRGSFQIYPKAILPGFASGVMWSVGIASWFIVNDLLSQAIAYPLLTTVPSTMVSLLGIFLYKEIKGQRNIAFFLLMFLFTFAGVTLSGLSKVFAI